MTKINQIYRCPICGNIVELLHAGNGQLVCCGQPMELLVTKDTDIGFEKHVPVITKTNTETIIEVGSIPHPMEEAHYIEFIEIIADGKVYRQFLKPGDKPIAIFKIQADNVQAREYCNVHGLWQSNQT
ncbi:MAG: desulfoferrodoxin [Candidatus Shapirobacteria bacterium]|nr:desulfoferrodoxin [Candidatus Shapirobacteria bacterium]